MRSRIDINCDLGEHDNNALATRDFSLMSFISSANIACGFHAGDKVTMRASMLAAKEKGVAIGLHPSFDDRQNFGRKRMEITCVSLTEILIKQWNDFKEIADELNVEINHIKAHGALYHQVCFEEEYANCFLSFVKSVDPELKIMGFSSSLLQELSSHNSMMFIREDFLDRRYENGRLVSRTSPDAMLHKKKDVVEQLERFVSGGESDSLCVHGDGKHAMDILNIVQKHLKEMEVEISSVV